MKAAACLIVSAAALLACTPPAPDAEQDRTTEARVATTPNAALSAIHGDQVASLLRGELRCTFATEAAGTVLIAAADVGSSGTSTAAIVLNGAAIGLTGVEKGGFSSLARGGRFRARDVTVEVARGNAIPTGDEGTRHDATMTVMRDGGAANGYAGMWSCGP